MPEQICLNNQNECFELLANFSKYNVRLAIGSHQYSFMQQLGPSINRLVTSGNTKLCCRAFILAQFHSTTANKIDSEHIQDYKTLLLVCEVEIRQVTVKQIEVFSSSRLISDDFRLKSAENS